MVGRTNANSNLGGVICLGTGTSFDIATLVPNVDYTKLTADNFIIVQDTKKTASRVSFINETSSFSGNYTANLTYTPPSVSYDASVGTLTVTPSSTTGSQNTGLSLVFPTVNPDTTVYLVCGEIKTLE